MWILLIFLIIILSLAGYLYQHIPKWVDTKPLHLDDASLITMSNKANCNTTNVSCFDHTDCLSKCVNVANCKFGSCVSTDLIPPETECDVSMGMMAFLVGDPKFGKYSFVCKSVDPGIAISSTENLMCRCSSSGSMTINYLDRFPQITSCMCGDEKNACIVPATRVKREHKECSLLAGMVPN